MKANISPRLIPNIASLYNDTNRIFMEYIDNSIDSAESFFDEENNRYKKDIKIELYVDKNMVSITDNCVGIANLPKVVETIGNSDKKEQYQTNGQFGFGIYSFLAACSQINIITKLEEDDMGHLISIQKSDFNVDSQDDVNLDDPIPYKFDGTSGTKIILTGFDKDKYKQIKFIDIKSEIEKHFELLLGRENLSIKIYNRITGDEHTCKSFGYADYDGEVYEENLSELTFKGDSRSTEFTVITKQPVHIYLKILKGKKINKPPVFISKGRRIAEIRAINTFKTKFRNEIWAHPSITGYVDVSNFLEPTIARNDFKNDNNSKALFSTLESLEELILDVIRDVNKASEHNDYKSLEKHLNRALSKLAKIDALNFRTENISGKDINLEGGGNGKDEEQNAGSVHHREGEPFGVETEHTENREDPRGFGPSDNDGSNPSDNDGSGASNREADNPFEDTGFRGGERKKSGFNIEFVDGDPMRDVVTDKQIRSQLIGGTIRIFREHPEFQKRITLTRTKESKISQRLITYLAGEITVHYKDKIQSREGQAEYNVQMFENLVEFIYDFEHDISFLEGKNLSDLGG
jgi:hypothetical protein